MGGGSRDALVAVVLVLLASGWCWLGATRTLELRDEGYILHRSARTAAGELPHRDFEAVYGPGVYVATAALERLGGGEIIAVRAALAGLRGLSVGVTFLVARSVAPMGVALIAALLAGVWWGRPSWNLNTPYAALYTVPLALGALLLLVRAEGRGSASGRLAAGLLAGCGVLFKQSLGVMLAGGMGLGLFAVALLRARPAGRRESALVLAVFALAALVPLGVASSYLGPAEYAIHFLPLHLVAAAVVARAIERGGAAGVADVARELIPYGVGVALPLLVVALGYAAVGALGGLLHGMFVLPRTLVDYFDPVALPGGGALVATAVALALSTAVLRLQRDRPRLAAGLLTTAAVLGLSVLAAPGLVGLSANATGRAALSLEQLWPSALGLAGAVVFWRQGAPGATLLVLFFHSMLCFQIFPRAGWNVWVVLGATTPLLAWLAARARAATLDARSGGLRRGLVLAALALPLVWVSLPALRGIVADPEGPDRIAVGLPGTRGIALSPVQAAKLPLAPFRKTVEFLKERTPADTPLFVLGNEYLLFYLSGRPNLLAELEVRLFLQAWGLLPQGAVDENEVLARLDAAPTARVIELRGPSSARLRARLPAVSEALDAGYEEEARFGPFRVLRARALAAP